MPAKKEADDTTGLVQESGLGECTAYLATFQRYWHHPNLAMSGWSLQFTG
jgi:hypothetical protein